MTLRNPLPVGPDPLACPVCHGPLVERGSRVRCRTCALHYPVRDGVYLLGPPFGTSPAVRDFAAERMSRLADEALRSGWKVATRRFTTDVLSGTLRGPDGSRLARLRAKVAGTTWQDTLQDVTDSTRAGWKFLLDLNPAAWVLFLGPSWGAAPINLARSVAHVVVLDGAMERLQVVRQHALEAGLENLTLARVMDPLRLPVPDGSVTVAIVPGLAEWFASLAATSRRATCEQDLLRELRRVLTPNGQIYVGADNQRSAGVLLGRRGPGSYRSHRAFREDARAAGFEKCRLFVPVPFRHRFHQVLDADETSHMNLSVDAYRTRGWVVRPAMKAWDAGNRRGALERRLYTLFPAFGAVLSNDPKSRPTAERVFEELAAKGQIPSSRLVNYHVRPKGVVVLTGTDAVVRLPLDHDADVTCARHHRALETLRADARIPNHLRRLFPAPYARGYFEGQAFFAESSLAGSSGRVYYSRGRRSYDRAIVNAAYLSCQLRRATEEPVAIDQAEFDRLCGAWLAELATLVPEASRSAIELLAGRLERTLRGRTLTLGWHHGDYDLANVLYDAGETVSGVVDFEVFDPRGLPLLDLMVLLARRPGRENGAAFGTLFARSILPRRLPALEQELLEREIETLEIDDDLYRALALCCWLNHLRLRRDSWLVRSPAWLEANLHEVLDTLRRMP